MLSRDALAALPAWWSVLISFVCVDSTWHILWMVIFPWFVTVFIRAGVSFIDRIWCMWHILCVFDTTGAVFCHQEFLYTSEWCFLWVFSLPPVLPLLLMLFLFCMITSIKNSLICAVSFRWQFSVQDAYCLCLFSHQCSDQCSFFSVTSVSRVSVQLLQDASCLCLLSPSGFWPVQFPFCWLAFQCRILCASFIIIVLSAVSFLLTGLYVQDACCVCSLPHQRCHFWGWQRCGGAQLPWWEVHTPRRDVAWCHMQSLQQQGRVSDRGQWHRTCLQIR